MNLWGLTGASDQDVLHAGRQPTASITILQYRANNNQSKLAARALYITFTGHYDYKCRKDALTRYMTDVSRATILDRSYAADVSTCTFLPGSLSSLPACHLSLITHDKSSSSALRTSNTRRRYMYSLTTAYQCSTVSVKKIPHPAWGFSDIFPQTVSFSPSFTCLLYVPINARLQIFIQLPATVTK